MGTVHADTRAGERMGAMGGPRHRPTAAIRYAVRSALADRATDDLVLVALSGGADSMALAAALAAEAPDLGLRAGAVIVDHGLLTDSSELARTTAERAPGLGLDPVEIVSVTVDPTGRGVEAAARDARYAALSSVAERLGASLVLLGHTRDDQAEQVLLGLARGSGARSLAGMPSVRGIFRRPLLGVTRGDTRSLCEAANLPWWDDPMNDDPAYLRVKARRALADLEGDHGPGIREALARTADQLREDADHLDALADAAYATLHPVESEQIAGEGPPSPAICSLSTGGLAELPRAVRTRVWRRLLIAAGAPAGQVSARHTDDCDRLLTDWHGQGPIHVPGDLRVSRSGGRIVLAPG